MNWDAMLVCGAQRAMGNNTANKPINPYKPDANAWLDGWADVLDVINSHSQVAVTKLLCLCRRTQAKIPSICSRHVERKARHTAQRQSQDHRQDSQAGSMPSMNMRGGSDTFVSCEPACAQAMAKLAGVKLSKAALSHVQVPRARYASPLLPDAAVQVGGCIGVETASKRLISSHGHTA